MSDLKKLAERLRKSLKLEKGAARRLYGRFNAEHQTEDHQSDLDRWINDADPDSRASIAQNRVPSEAEKLRQGNKLAAKTKSRRNPLTGEREYLLHRGMHSEEKRLIHDSGAGYSGHSSWTPDYNQAYRFSRDYNGLGTDMGPDRKGKPSGLDFHEYVKSAWVPDSKIAFVPNQLHVAGDYSSEHEVVVHPHKPQYAHPDLIKPLKERAHLPGAVPPPPQSLKQRLKGRFGKSLAATLESMQKAVPVGPKMAEFFHDLGAHRRFMAKPLAENWVREHIKRENGRRELKGQPLIDVDSEVLAHMKAVQTPSGWRMVAPHRQVTATAPVKYDPKIGLEWENKAKNEWFHTKNDALDWIEREAMKPGLMRPADVYHHLKILPGRDGSWKVVRASYPGEVVPRQTGEHPQEQRAVERGKKTYDPLVANKWLQLQGDQKFDSPIKAKEWVAQQGGDLDHVLSHLKIVPSQHGRFRFVDVHFPRDIVDTTGPSPTPSARSESTPRSEPEDTSNPQTSERSGGTDDESAQRRMREGSAAQQWEEDHHLILSRQHMPEIWREHHPELVAGLKPNTSVHKLGGSITPGLRVASHADEDQHVLVKPPLNIKEYKMVAENVARVHRHFLDESFTSSHREAVYHKMAQDFFGLGQYVPRTTVFHHPHTGAPHSAHDFLKGMRPLAGVLQAEYDKHYADNKVPYEEANKRGKNAEREFFENNVGRSEVQKLALMNMVMGNNDRHSGNALVTKDNKLKLIDHGLTMDYGESERGDPLGNNEHPTYARRFWDEGLAPETHEWIRSLDPKKMIHHLGAAGVPKHLAAVAVNRVNELKDWSKESQAAHQSGSQNHQGKLSHAYERIKMHTLNEDGELRPASEIEERRGPLKVKTDKVGT